MREEVKDILEIDKFSLDEEWERQSVLYMEWAERVAEKQLHRDRMKFNLEYVKANLDYQIRSSPEKYGITRVTEASIQNAIINQPELGILGIGAVVKRPVVIETPEGDVIGIKPMMMLSLSHDHRLVDGMLGGLFIKHVKDTLENFDVGTV